MQWRAPHWLCQRWWSHGGNDDHPTRPDVLRHWWAAFLPSWGRFASNPRQGGSDSGGGQPFRTQKEYAIRDAQQSSGLPARECVAPTLEETYKWVALTPMPRDKALLAILLRIDAGVTENTTLKREVVRVHSENEGSH